MNMTINKQFENESTKMPEELKVKVESLTKFQKKYAEARARGIKQADAAIKAGSQANGRQALGRVGYNTEQTPGIKEYISFLEEVRARHAMVDSIEIVEKLRRVYDEAIDAGKFNDANKAAELLGSMIGLFTKGQQGIKAGPNTSSSGGAIENNVDAFKEEGETTQERIKRMTNLIGKLK